MEISQKLPFDGPLKNVLEGEFNQCHRPLSYPSSNDWLSEHVFYQINLGNYMHYERQPVMS